MDKRILFVAAFLFGEPQGGHTQPATTIADSIYTLVDQMPAFNGDLLGYLARNISYPDDPAVGVFGKVSVEFTADTNGIVIDPAIRRSSHEPEFDAEIVRVIRAMPPWIPGSLDGRRVSVRYRLPIRICPD